MGGGFLHVSQGDPGIQLAVMNACRSVWGVTDWLGDPGPASGLADDPPGAGSLAVRCARITAASAG